MPLAASAARYKNTTLFFLKFMVPYSHVCVKRVLTTGTCLTCLISIIILFWTLAIFSLTPTLSHRGRGSACFERRLSP